MKSEIDSNYVLIASDKGWQNRDGVVRYLYLLKDFEKYVYQEQRFGELECEIILTKPKALAKYNDMFIHHFDELYSFGESKRKIFYD